ncbi:MAG: GerMN domain-containing protein [bacterium]|nr:GerMN domain-containing protein [bacterium]
MVNLRAVAPVLALFLFGGCLRPPAPSPGARATVALYFADTMAQFTVPEDREIDLQGKSLALRVVEELTAGPRGHGLHPTIPRGTRVRGVDVVQGVARVDFSREFVDNHPGGSAGEAMTLRSLIFTLTDLEGVEGITILVEGKAIDLLAGHLELRENAGRWGILAYPVFIDPERASWLQERADQGHETWRRDPLAVAMRDGRMAGFRLTDQFRLTGQTGSQAVVEAVHGGRSYTIELGQPVKTGPAGIWLITAILDGG